MTESGVVTEHSAQHEPASAGTQVVLGFDADRPAPHLVRIAAREAALRGVGLSIVTVARPSQYRDVSQFLNLGGSEQDWWTWSGSEVRRTQRTAGRSVRSQYPDLPVSLTYLGADDLHSPGEPFTAATLLVLGGTSSFGRRPFGPDSTGGRLMRAVGCPTLVVPGSELISQTAGVGGGADPYDMGPVVAAVASGSRGVEVIREAEAEMRRRGSELHLLRAFECGPGETHADALGNAEADLTAQVQQARLRTETRWTAVLADQEPVAVVREQMPSAGVLVLGGRSGAASDPVLGDRTRDLLDSCPCLVLLLPGAGQQRER